MFRLIARLDIKGPNLVKGVRMEGLRVLGRPADFARRYSVEGWELLLVDIVASLYGRNQLEALLHETTDGTTVPVTVGGGINSLAEVDRMFRAGADRVALNSAAVRRPALIAEIADRYGCQAVVVAVDAVQIRPGLWEVVTDGARERSGLEVSAWCERAVAAGAGELVVTSVDQEGRRRGFDLGLIDAVAHNTPVPVIAGGGCGTLEHIEEARCAGADGVAIASALHYNTMTVEAIDERLTKVQFSAAAPSGARRASPG